jgi:hypothetical protein
MSYEALLCFEYELRRETQLSPKRTIRTAKGVGLCYPSVDKRKRRRRYKRGNDLQGVSPEKRHGGGSGGCRRREVERKSVK